MNHPSADEVTCSIHEKPLDHWGICPDCDALVADIVRRRRERDLQPTAVSSNQWVSLAERMPPANCPRLLVTNNVNARDAIGHASHLWLVHMVHKYADGTFGAFTDHDLKLHGLTHWRYAVPEDSHVETSRDVEDAARYRFLREPGNAIVYAKDRNAWGDAAHPAAGHVRYDTPEQLDAAIDTARRAENGKVESEPSKGMDWQRCYRGAVEECRRLRDVIISAYRHHHQPCECPACRFIVDEEAAPGEPERTPC